MTDEYAVLCYYNGNPIEAHRTTKMLMESDVYSSIPEKDRERIEKNMEFYSKSIENNKTEDAKEVKDNVKEGEKVES